jgi:DNA-directed RNA polymerase specialized sigma54-like protein
MATSAVRQGGRCDTEQADKNSHQTSAYKNLPQSQRQKNISKIFVRIIAEQQLFLRRQCG